MMTDRPGRTGIMARVNYTAADIRWSSGRRGYGVFLWDNFPRRHRIIREQPVLSCVHRRQPPFESSVAQEWNGFNGLYRAFLAEKFRRLRKVSRDGTTSRRDEKRLVQFIRDYAFADPLHGKAHVYGLSSYINHACVSCANAEVWVDSNEPNYITVRLMKPVSKDQEVYINYNRRNLNFNCAVCGSRGLLGFLSNARKKIVALVKRSETADGPGVGEEEDETPKNT